MRPIPTHPLSELAFSIGTVVDGSATTADVLATYRDHLECDAVAVYARTATPDGTVSYRRRAAVPSVPDSEPFRAALEHLPADADGDEDFRASLPIVDTVDGMEYWLLEIPDVGVLVLLEPAALSAETVDALEPLNERVGTFITHSAGQVASEFEPVGQPGQRHEPESYDQLRWIIDLFPQPVFVKDETGRYLVANDALADMFGMTIEDIEGATDDEVIASRTEVSRVQAHDMAVIEANKPIEITGERVTDAAGKRRVFDTTKVPYDTLDDGRRAILAVANDVTERRERERELERSRDFLEKVQESASIGAWEVDDAGETLRWEDEVSRIIGRSPEYEATVKEALAVIHPDDRSMIETAFETLMAEGTSFDREVRITTATDDVRWVRIRADPRHDDEGTYIGARGIVQDIHERKARELELEQLKERFERFAGAVRYGFTLIRPDYSEMLYQNPAAAEMYGVSAADLRDDPLAWLERVHPDDRERVANAFETDEPATLDGTQSLEFRIDHSDNGYRWLLIRSHAVLDDDGSVAHLASVTVDITERRRLEDELRASEQSLRRLVEIASDTKLSFEQKRSQLLALGCDHLGLPYGFLNRDDGDEWVLVDAVGTHPELQIGGPSPAARPCRQCSRSPKSIVAIEDIQTDETIAAGTTQPSFECYLGSTVLVDGESYGTLCFADDSPRAAEFTRSERAFVELLVQWLGYELTGQQVEHRLRELNETARHLMAAETPAEIAAVATESADDILEIPVTGIWDYNEQRDALVPRAMAAGEQTGVDELPTFERERDESAATNGHDGIVWEVFETGERLVRGESTTVLATESETMAIHSKLLLPLGTHGLLIAGSTEDTTFSETDRNLLEILAATVEAALDRAEHEQLLRTARADLERSNQQLEQFAYAASHDIKEPLRSAANYLTLFEELYEPGDTLDEDAFALLEQATAGTQRLRSMIDGLLQYSRIESVAEPTDPVEFDSVVDQATLNLAVRLDETDGTVTRDALPTVRGDNRLLVQLVQNLLDNGLKYHGGDHPQVHVALAADEPVSPDDVADATGGTRPETDCYHVRVEDNGKGMDPDAVSRAFDVFERHGRRDDDGTGMGLPLCQRIVEHHGGALSIDSELGVGTAVNLWLPAADS
ncbi:PAS domain S-box protein [Natronolimnobius sp. AArcel1]|uniref:PAS domain S-box protein n=1 Tax=Natronolimnobius sp. AArcel1 TaxID=1679093 RepID=UPI0013EAFE97|nr:PAS domain S-box protein [Natronolimnobius sp. AArcel1]NGM68607.1 PAS domain S-box protein [Natronolimnobius sp. AArcel1]